MTKSERIQAMKWKKYNEQEGICPSCGQRMVVGDVLHLSHILRQSKLNIRLYGEDIIHHALNMKLTHGNDYCNQKVEMSEHKTELVNEHVNMIRKEIENEAI